MSSLFVCDLIIANFYVVFPALSGSEQADTAYGVFCLFNMIIYLVYAIILSVHRRSVTISSVETNVYKTDNTQVVNPHMGDGGGDYGNDEVEL